MKERERRGWGVKAPEWVEAAPGTRTRIKAPEKAEAPRARVSRRQSVLRQRARAYQGAGVGRGCARTRIKAPE